MELFHELPDGTEIRISVNDQGRVHISGAADVKVSIPRLGEKGSELFNKSAGALELHMRSPGGSGPWQVTLEDHNYAVLSHRLYSLSLEERDGSFVLVARDGGGDKTKEYVL